MHINSIQFFLFMLYITKGKEGKIQRSTSLLKNQRFRMVGKKNMYVHMKKKEKKRRKKRRKKKKKVSFFLDFTIWHYENKRYIQRRKYLQMYNRAHRINIYNVGNQKEWP